MAHDIQMKSILASPMVYWFCLFLNDKGQIASCSVSRSAQLWEIKAGKYLSGHLSVVSICVVRALFFELILHFFYDCGVH